LAVGNPTLSFQFGRAKFFQSTWGKGSVTCLNGPYLVASLSTMVSKVAMLGDFVAAVTAGGNAGAGSKTGSRTGS